MGPTVLERANYKSEIYNNYRKYKIKKLDRGEPHLGPSLYIYIYISLHEKAFQLILAISHNNLESCRLLSNSPRDCKHHVLECPARQNILQILGLLK